jgi:hypothetical protein
MNLKLTMIFRRRYSPSYINLLATVRFVFIKIFYHYLYSLLHMYRLILYVFNIIRLKSNFYEINHELFIMLNINAADKWMSFKSTSNNSR